MTRQQLQKIIKFFLFGLAKVDYQNTHFVPPEGPLIVVTNHLSRLDIPVLLENPVRPEITALVAEKYREHWFLSWILNTCGIIYLDRSKADFSAFREARRVIQSGVAMGIAPEGTRSHDQKLAEGKEGAAMLAMQLQVPIVPVGIHGTEQAFKTLGKFRRPVITARFGESFLLPSFTRDNRAEQLKKGTEEIMCRIAVLLPEQYHGFYTDHPRLKELAPERPNLKKGLERV
jgi:1-acyl-sn-glycerol-3-phosphate acyltransferase